VKDPNFRDLFPDLVDLNEEQKIQQAEVQSSGLIDGKDGERPPQKGGNWAMSILALVLSVIAAMAIYQLKIGNQGTAD